MNYELPPGSQVSIVITELRKGERSIKLRIDEKLQCIIHSTTWSDTVNHLEKIILPNIPAAHADILFIPIKHALIGSRRAIFTRAMSCVPNELKQVIHIDSAPARVSFTVPKDTQKVIQKFGMKMG